jgi:CheY-like chemotaxis protein
MRNRHWNPDVHVHFGARKDMMTSPHVLLIEDDKFKADRVAAAIASAHPNSSITRAESVHAAVLNIQRRTFDVIILDMALPSHDLLPGTGQSSSLLSGGLELVMEVAYLRRSEAIIILTQYPEIEIEGHLHATQTAKSELQSLFSVNIAAVILYENDSERWRTELLATMDDCI